MLKLLCRRSFGTDEEFFVQLFVEAGKHNIPKTQDLLTEMFKEQQITFAKVNAHAHITDNIITI